MAKGLRRGYSAKTGKKSGRVSGTTKARALPLPAIKPSRKTVAKRGKR